MTSNVAAVLAVLAVVLVVSLGWLVLRLRGQLCSTRAQIASLEQRQVDLVAQLEQTGREQRDTWQAIELALQGQQTGSTAQSSQANGNGSRTDTGAVTVITDIDTEQLDGLAGLTTARIASVTLGGPLIKVAAFSHGVRHALDEQQRMRVRYAVRKELRRQRKMRRRRRAEPPLSKRAKPSTSRRRSAAGEEGATR